MQLYNLEWDELVPGRDAAAVRRRWHLMSLLVPDRRNMELHQQVCTPTALCSLLGVCCSNAGMWAQHASVLAQACAARGFIQLLCQVYVARLSGVAHDPDRFQKSCIAAVLEQHDVNTCAASVSDTVRPFTPSGSCRSCTLWP